MRVLLIKTSSMGDVIHTLPALTDAGLALKNIQFDWVVEDIFAEIPTWHPLVANVIPVALRRWRKGFFAKSTRTEWQALRRLLHAHHYDLILDAQGLIKSAFLGFFAKGVRAGLDFRSARESFASLAYQKKYTVNFHQHAIVRMRQLFSLALQYPLPETPPQFNLSAFTNAEAKEQYVVFLHGTTWATKLWPEVYWQRLGQLAKNAGYRIKISGGNAEELQRAKRIADGNEAIDLLPRLEISTMANLLANAKAAIAVDTGFGHLAAALDIPTVSIYGATNAAFTGALGKQSIHLSADFPCSPCLLRDCNFKNKSEVTPACYATISPELVWSRVMGMVEGKLSS